MANKKLPRGVRENNPGNIRHSKSKWQGMASVQNDKEFVTFTDAKYGIRAIAVILTNYGEKYGLDTVQEVISRWAPPEENNTNAYAKLVADALGVGPEDHIDIHDPDVMRVLVKAIIKQENGSVPYTDKEIDAGIALAGGQVKKKPLTKSRTIAGGSVATLAGAATIIEETMKAVDPALPIVQYLAQYAPWVLGVAVVVAGVVVIYARWDDHRNA